MSDSLRHLAALDPAPCIFCGRPAGSHEHVWPDWLRRYAPSIVTGADAAERDRLLQEATIVVDCVCDRCNRGWMKKLEDTVSPVMKRMMIGESVTLPTRAVKRLRQWAIKTAVMFDARDGELRASELLRRGLQRGQEPESVTVIAGQYRGRHLLEHTAAILCPLGRPDVTLAWVTLLAGQVVFYVFTNFDAVQPTATLTPQARRNFYALPPRVSEPIEWPPPEPINDEIIDVLRNGPNGEVRNAPRAHLLGPTPSSA